MKIETADNNTRLRQTIEMLLVAANGGTKPRIDVHVADDDTAPLPSFAPESASATLLVQVAYDGYLVFAVGIRVHWKTLWQTGFRMARTPGGQLILLGFVEGRPGHFVVEDDRLWGEAGSPMLSADQDRDAIAAFDSELAALIATAQ